MYEQICASRTNIKSHYIPNKPHKLGNKLYFLYGQDKFVHKSEVYPGNENKFINHLPNEPDLGYSGNVVVRLHKEISHNKNFKRHSNNFYSSIILMKYFAEKVVLCLGIVRKNKIQSCKLLKMLQNMKRQKYPTL